MAAPLGVLAVGPTTATTKVEYVDGGAPVGAAGISGSDHHRSPSRILEVQVMKVQ
jgi:hypothetical protein